MKRRIIVTIDANKTTCGGRCRYKSQSDNHFSICWLFDASIYKSERCGKCIAAEAAYKEATRV